jgi:hypothetical protein
MQPREAMYYETALEEVSHRTMVSALAAKALVDSDGDERRAVARYIQLRVDDLRSRFEEDLESTRKRQADKAAMEGEVLVRAQAAMGRFQRTGELDDEELALSLSCLWRDKTIVLVSDRVRGNTLLHFCARNGLLHAVSSLVSAGANPSARNGNGQMPVSVASTPEIAEFLRSANGAAKA